MERRFAASYALVWARRHVSLSDSKPDDDLLAHLGVGLDGWRLLEVRLLGSSARLVVLARPLTPADYGIVLPEHVKIRIDKLGQGLLNWVS